MKPIANFGVTVSMHSKGKKRTIREERTASNGREKGVVLGRGQRKRKSTLASVHARPARGPIQ